MNIADIYEKIKEIGCLTFATIENGYPQTRIIHPSGFDHEGIYFRTMITKPFYKQIKTTGKVSICGMYPSTSVSHDDEGMPYFKPGYTLRVTGDVKELSPEALKEKAAVNDMLMLDVKDADRYPAMKTFCLYRGWGEVFDFDFEMEHRSHKLLRTGFSFGGADIPFRGIRITDECLSCGECMEGCSFKAIFEKDDRYFIDHTKCDACGDCYIICPADAVEIIAS